MITAGLKPDTPSRVRKGHKITGVTEVARLPEVITMGDTGCCNLS